MFVFTFDKNSVVWVWVHVHNPPPPPHHHWSCFGLRVSRLHDLPAVFDTQKWSLKLDFSSHLAGNDCDETHLELKSRRFHLIFPRISLQPQNSVPIIWVQTFPRPTAGSAAFWQDSSLIFPTQDTRAKSYCKWVSETSKKEERARERERERERELHQQTESISDFCVRPANTHHKHCHPISVRLLLRWIVRVWSVGVGGTSLCACT